MVYWKLSLPENPALDVYVHVPVVLPVTQVDVPWAGWVYDVMVIGDPLGSVSLASTGMPTAVPVRPVAESGLATGGWTAWVAKTSIHAFDWSTTSRSWVPGKKAIPWGWYI